MPRTRHLRGGSQASDNVMSGISPMWPLYHTGGAAACAPATVAPDLINQYANPTVPLSSPSTVPGGIDYAAVNASTMSLLNNHLTNMDHTMTNSFAYSGQFSPPLMVGGAWWCPFCSAKHSKKTASTVKAHRKKPKASASKR